MIDLKVFNHLPRWRWRRIPRPPRHQSGAVRRTSRVPRPAVIRKPCQRVEDLRQPPRPLLRHIQHLTLHNTNKYITSRHNSVTVKSQLNYFDFGTHSAPTPGRCRAHWRFVWRGNGAAAIFDFHSFARAVFRTLKKKKQRLVDGRWEIRQGEAISRR